MSLYDDISKLIDDEEAGLDAKQEPIEQARLAARKQADADHDAAYAIADQTYDADMAPLLAEQDRLEALRHQVEELAAQASEPTPDPTAPSAPEPSAPTDSSASSNSRPTPTETSATDSPSPALSPSQPSVPDAPVIPPAPSEPTPSTPSGADSQPQVPTGSPDEAATFARGVDASQPVAVSLPTGEVKVVTAGDVMAAKDGTIADDALTTTQLDLRRSNSDWP